MEGKINLLLNKWRKKHKKLSAEHNKALKTSLVFTEMKIKNQKELVESFIKDLEILNK